ncbi:MAG: chromosome partitioning protein ParA, partial [Chitinophagaceae bacterium]
MFNWLLLFSQAFAKFGFLNLALFSALLFTLFLTYNLYASARRRRKADAKLLSKANSTVQLKDQVANDLDTELLRRNRELRQKSKEILQKNILLEQQASELAIRNATLKRQEEQILTLNVLLEIDHVPITLSNLQLNQTGPDLDAASFVNQYPNKEACYEFLAEMKWQNGYSCIKCGNDNYCKGKIPYNRRCTKCTYEESVLHHTIFENNRIPIEKAFYLLYLMYSNKGAISSHKLAEKLGIRQSTCWT